MSNGLGGERTWRVQGKERRPDWSWQGEDQERGMDGSRDEMVMCGGSWGGTEMQHAEMGTKLRDRELRGGKTG